MTGTTEPNGVSWIVIRERDRAVLAVSGELDAHAAEQVKAVVLDIFATGQHHLCIDLTEVTFIDSAGLGLLNQLSDHARGNGGAVEIIDGARTVARVVEPLTEA
jgi:anti-anti-sigma factor